MTQMKEVVDPHPIYCPADMKPLVRLGGTPRPHRKPSDWDYYLYVAYRCDCCHTTWYDWLDGSPLTRTPPKRTNRHI